MAMLAALTIETLQILFPSFNEGHSKLKWCNNPDSKPFLCMQTYHHRFAFQQQNGCSIEKEVYNQNPVSLLSPARDEKWKEAGGGKIMYIYTYI